jgi:hypothetical protein
MDSTKGYPSAWEMVVYLTNTKRQRHRLMRRAPFEMGYTFPQVIDNSRTARIQHRPRTALAHVGTWTSCPELLMFFFCSFPEYESSTSNLPDNQLSGIFSRKDVLNQQGNDCVENLFGKT